jgi:hypothetical protein
MGGSGQSNYFFKKKLILFLNCFITGQFLGDIFVNAISYKRSLQVIFHDFFLLGDNFFLKICFLGKRCFREKKNILMTNLIEWGQKKIAYRQAREREGEEGLSVLKY